MTTHARTSNSSTERDGSDQPPIPPVPDEVQAVLDAMPEPVVVFMPLRNVAGEIVDLGYRFANAAALARLGRRSADIVGHTVGEVFPAVPGSREWTTYLEQIDTGETVRVEMPWHDKIGDVAGTFAVSGVRYDGDIVVTALDVTARVVAEEQFRRERDFNKATLDTVGALIAVVDADGRFVRFNRQSEVMTGYRESEVLGKTWEFLVPVVDRPLVAEALQEAAVGHVITVVSHYFAKGGQERLVRWSFTALADREGRRTHLIGMGIDVTEQQETEDALRSSQAALSEAASYARSLVETSLDPLVTISADGTITDVNESTVRATGVPREQLVGTDFSEYFTEPLKARASYEQVFAEGQVTNYPLTIKHKDGTLTEVLYNASLFRDSVGDVRGVFAVARDVTAVRRAERQLAAWAEEMEAANLELGRSNRDLEQFAYVASHDLREPLRAIAGPLALVAERYRDQLDEQAIKYLNLAVDGSRRMQALIDGLLTYSRIGRVEAERTRTQAGEAVAYAMASLRALLDSTHAVVTVAPLPAVLAEPAQLEQVFQNLISNAVKFVAPGVVPHVDIAAEAVESGWRFDVTDNGVGIPSQDRDRVFTMFARLHPTEDYEGTGIGLAMVKKIIERHGGAVGVDDAPGGSGCRFWFTLPAAAGDAPAG